MTRIPIETNTATAESIEAAVRDANAGDTIEFCPVEGKALLLDRTADMTSEKEIHVEATGATFYSRFLGPCIAFGAPLGMQAGAVSLKGGVYLGGLLVQNINHSLIMPTKCYGSGQYCPALEHRADVGSGYNYFQVPGGLGASDVLFQMTLLNKMAWTNFFDFRATSFGIVKSAIGVVCPDGINYPPSCGLFDHCAFEGAGFLLDCPFNVSFAFMNLCYCEGEISVGEVGPFASVVFDAWQGKLTGADASDTRYNFLRRA